MKQLYPIIRRARRSLLPDGETQKETKATEVAPTKETVGVSKFDLPSPSPQPEEISSCTEASPAAPGEGEPPAVDRDTDSAGKSDGTVLQVDLSLLTSAATKLQEAPVNTTVEPGVPTPSNKRAKSKPVSKTA